jgi:hypothetical protein
MVSILLEGEKQVGVSCSGTLGKSLGSGGIRTLDLLVKRPAPYHYSTNLPLTHLCYIMTSRSECIHPRFDARLYGTAGQLVKTKVGNIFQLV